MKNALAGKRSLDLSTTRLLGPPAANFYETVDGKIVRVFYGSQRKSTSALLAIGVGQALMKCVRFAWAMHNDHCPHDLDKICIT